MEFKLFTFFPSTVTYSIDNKLFQSNTLYLNLNETKLKQLNSNYFYEFDEIENDERLVNEEATCERYESFEFIITSSQIIGYASLQTIFAKTRSKKINYIRCSIFNGECNCIPLNNKANSLMRDNFLKSRIFI